MILTPGFETTYMDSSYRVAAILHTNRFGYRDVYRAHRYNKETREAQDVCLIVYSKQRISDRFLKGLPQQEAQLRSALKTDSFEPYIDAFETESDSGERINIIVTEYWETWSLRSSIQKNTISQQGVWDVFRDVVIGLNEISNHDGACHFNINPDTVHVRILSDGSVRGVIHGLDAVSNDFTQNADINKALVYPDCRPPETHFSEFTPVSMEFSLALLLIYMYQHRHPWGITPELSGFRAYTAMRHNPPKIKIDGELSKVLAKAISVAPGQRYKTLDDFVEEVMKYSETKLPDTYVCFGSGKAIEADSPNTPAETNDDDDDMSDDDMTSMFSTKTPSLDVKITKRKGNGLADVAGMEGLKRSLKNDFVDIYRHPDIASQYGLRIPSCILYGPPGCGKTFIINKLAEELGADFISVTPAVLGSIYIHGSQLLIRQLFEKAIKRSQKTGKGTLIFLDEIDAMCPRRTMDDSGNQAGEVAEFLTQLNNLADKGVHVVAATNCMELIDPSVLRTGRFDKTIFVPVPDTESRKQLFEYELAKRPHTDDIDYAKLSELTDGFTSSDITYIVTECARKKFAETLMKNTDEVLAIDQSLIEDVIADTRPSVSQIDLKHYEEMRVKYGCARESARRSAGFNI